MAWIVKPPINGEHVGTVLIQQNDPSATVTTNYQRADAIARIIGGKGTRLLWSGYLLGSDMAARCYLLGDNDPRTR